MGHSEIAEMVVEACLRKYGWGQTFHRADGLEREARRAAAREAYLREHPETSAASRRMILEAGVTAGMTKAEVVAAWGLLGEDLSAAGVRATADDENTYEWWSGFDVGEQESYELFFTNEVLVGVRADAHAEPSFEPTGDSEREADKRIAWLTEGFWYFYTDTDGYLRGATIDPHDADWDTLHLHLYKVGLVPHYTKDIKAVRKAERRVRRDGRWGEYAGALAAGGLDARSAHPERRCAAILSLYPEASEVELTTEGVNDERTKRAEGFYPPVAFIRSPVVQAPRASGFDDVSLAGLPRWVVETVPPGRYAMWWPTPHEEKFTHLGVANAISRIFAALNGIEPYVYTALLHRFGLIDTVEAPVELPDELRAVYFRDDEGNHFVFSASREKGLRFHFPVGVVSAEYRNDFWYRFNGFADAWREAVEASAAPLYETDPSPQGWWWASFQAVVVAEQEGHRVEVVGALVL